MITPYPEPQLKGYVSSHSSRNTSKSTFEISPKPCRPHTSKVGKTQTWPLHYRLVLFLSRQAKHAFRPPAGGHVLPSAKRLWCHCSCRYRLAGQPLPLGATCSKFPSDFVAIAWWFLPYRQTLHQYNEITSLKCCNTFSHFPTFSPSTYLSKLSTPIMHYNP